MKKVLLSIATLAICSSAINAQQRLVLYEEFTGENCGPCAATNPGLWTLMSANTTKAIMIKYMSPIPSAGIFYYQDSSVTNNRLSYYNVPFAPYARMDGMVKSQTQTNPGHPGYLTQADIDSNYNVPSPFQITATAAWNSTYDSIITTIHVHAVAAYAPTNGNVKLRVALTETVDWTNPPGDNGEKNFENVVRTMFPDANGTSIPASWTSGTTNTYIVKGAVPAYVDKSGSPFMTVWIQNDAVTTTANATDNIMNVAQVALSSALTIPLDVASSSIVSTPNLVCISGSSTTVSPVVTIKNTGATTTLTAATVYYNLDGGTWSSAPWSGSLAPGATANVTLPAISVTTAGQHYVYDSVAVPNGSVDVNPANNTTYAYIWVQSTTPNALPLSSGFENTTNPSNLDPNWSIYGNNADGADWRVYTGTPVFGHNGSTYCAGVLNYQFANGESTYLIMPTPAVANPSAVDFWVAYEQLSASSTDALAFVYSTDCGNTWTSLWSSSGASLATGPVNSSSAFLPTAAQWVEHSVNTSTVPAGAMVAFRETTGGGNIVWIDDINMRNGWPLGVEVVTAASIDANIYPNPAKDMATLSFNLSSESTVEISVLDAVGRTVSVIANQDMTVGAQKFEINTANFASGMYNVVIRTDKGTVTQRLNVVK